MIHFFREFKLSFAFWNLGIKIVNHLTAVERVEVFMLQAPGLEPGPQTNRADY